MADTINPFSPRSAENPGGALFREFTVTLAARAEDDTDPRLAVAISSEAAVERYDYMKGERYMEVLDHTTGGVDLTYARDGLPFCLDHSLRSQVGLLEDITIDDDRVIRGKLRKGNHPDAQWVFDDMASGIRKKVSIGYWPGNEYEQTNGENGVIPTRRLKGWMLYEASSVSVPADYDVGVGRSASGRTVTPEAGPVSDPFFSQRKEPQMSMDNAPVSGTPAAPDTRGAELAVIAREAGMSARLADWMLDGTTVADARKQAFDSLRAAKVETVAAAPAVVVGNDRASEAPWGADGVDFVRAVVSAGRGGPVDARLRAQNTVIGDEGGFAVPQAVVNTMLEATMTGGELLSRVSTRPVTNGNTYTETLVKEEARTNGSRNGGVRGYWLAEDGSYTESQASTRQLDLKLQKLGALVKLTEEQIDDGPALVSFLNEQVPEELRFVAEQAVWEGDGTAKPLGALSSGALVTVAIEGSQTIANTAGNIWVNAAKMYSRMPTSMLQGAAFFINQSLYAKILTATAGTAGGSHPMFTPPGQLAAFPNGAIYGKPIVPIEYASAEGTVGDFVFANFADYLLISKGGVRQSTSLHAEFTRDRQLMKFTWRLNGAPRTRTPLTPFKGSDTLSPYIALAARS